MNSWDFLKSVLFSEEYLKKWEAASHYLCIGPFAQKMIFDHIVSCYDLLTTYISGHQKLLKDIQNKEVSCLLHSIFLS